jgi:ureidoglycolate dehydrogenase (NAD+)
MGDSSTSTVMILPDRLAAFAARIMVSAGVRSRIARTTAAGLVAASVRGVDSHGIRLLPHYVAEVEAGRINPHPRFEVVETAAGVAQFDADHGYGIAASRAAMRHAIELAMGAGVGHVSVSNSSHNGMLAYIGLTAAAEDMIGVVMTHTSANTRPPGGTRPFFGSNPVCVTAPMRDEGPYCFDAATSSITFNEVRQQRDEQGTLPEQTAADADGAPTRDPAAATQLLPLGGYKGFGLAMNVDIFSGLLSGMAVGREVSAMFGEEIGDRRRLGHHVVAVNIASFVDPAVFKRRLQTLADAVRTEPQRSTATPNQVPGDPEKMTQRRRETEGIPMNDQLLQELNRLAGRYDVAAL